MQSQILFLVVVCVAAAFAAEEDVPADRSTPIHCVNCNSAVEGEEWCADSDEVAAKITDSPNDPAVSKQCSESPIEGAEWKGCRKTMMYVNNVDDGALRIIRECAYTGEDVDGQKRTGNKGIKMYYYQCSDADNCNGAISVAATTGALLTTMALVAARFA
jgi:hypothetical protein